MRPGAPGSPPPPPPPLPPDSAALFTTYHPLLVEFGATLPAHAQRLCRSAPGVRPCRHGVNGLEDYPIFLPPRSMAEVEFVETLERLAGGWRIGTQPHSRARARTRRGNDNTPNGKLTIEAPPERTSSPLAPSSIPSPAPVKALLLQAPGTLFGPLLPSTSSPASHSALALVPPIPSPSPAPALHSNIDLTESFDCTRIVPAPVAERQRARAEQIALEKQTLTSSPSSTSTSS